MFLKYLLLLLIGIHHSVLSEKSFTIVVDTTKSMEDEINLLKLHLASVVNEIRTKEFTNYIFIPFGDQEVGPHLISTSPDEMLDNIQFLEVSGGEECPENSLAAIQKALEVSMPKSNIYVFTDAQENTRHQLGDIKKLCQVQQSQVVIFQSGTCGPVNDVNQLEKDNIYYEVTRNCGGTIFHLNLKTFQNVFKYIKEITKIDWSDVNTHQEFTTNKKYTLTIDTYTKDLVVAVSGKYPVLQITNTFGNSPHIEKIVENPTMLVIRINVAQIGEYITEVSCQGFGVVTFYRKDEIQFLYGFSPLQPNSLRETTQRPLPGIMNYIIISLPDDSTEVISVHIQMLDNYDVKTVEYSPVEENKTLYVIKIFVEPDKAFKILIRCRDKISYQEITGASALLKPQDLVTASERLAPTIDIIELENALVDFGSLYKAACKVVGYPKPEIWWENDVEEILTFESALLEIPSTYISYVTVANVTKNGTITCLSKNDEGENGASINLYVNRTFVFDVIRYPTDMTIEYGGEGKMFCEVNAYPDAEIKWYHNDTLVEETENIQIVRNENMLLINKMGIDETGDYKCVISNNVEEKTYLAKVYISGLEAPQIEVKNLEIILKPGDWTDQECTVLKGIPIPEVTWKRKSESGSLDDLPEGVFVEGKSLKIPSADMEHGGFYVCEARNLLGVDSQELSVKVQYAPKIKNSDEVKTVREGDLVELRCDVDAVPKADVHWDMYQDDVIIAFDERHHTDEKYTHRFSARYNDSGMYHCIADNNMGRAVKTVTLNVLVAPYIEPLPWKSLTVRRGDTVTLTCNVSFGNPVPSTKWQYVAQNFDTVILLRSNSAGKLDLVLENVNRRQEGTYQCVAENEVGPDNVKIYLRVL